MKTEITKKQIEHEKNDAIFCIRTAANYGRHVVVSSGLFSPLKYYQNKAGEIVLGLVPDDHPTKAKDKPAKVAREVVYYIDERHQVCCTEVTEQQYSEIERVFEGSSGKVLFLWGLGEVPSFPTGPLHFVATDIFHWIHWEEAELEAAE